MSFTLAEFRERIRYEKRFDTYEKLEDVYGVNRWYLWHIIEKDDYIPSAKICASLDIEYYAPAPVCPTHGIVHCYDCETELVKPRRNGTAPARKRTPPIRIGEATEEELEAIKTYLTTDERRVALVEAANKKRRS